MQHSPFSARRRGDRAEPRDELARVNGKQQQRVLRPASGASLLQQPYPKVNTSNFWTEALYRSRDPSAARDARVLRPGCAARGWLRRHHHSRFSGHRSLPHGTPRLAPAHRIPALFFRYRYQRGVSEPSHPASPEPDDRKSVGGDRTQDSSDRSQPWRSDRPLGCGPTAEGRGLSHHAWQRPSAARLRIEPFFMPPRLFGCGFSRSTAAEYFPIAIPDAAPAIFWIPFAARFLTRWSRPRFTRARTASWTGAIA